MRKLKLELDDLKVESFVAGRGDGTSTVRAHATGAYDGCTPGAGGGGGAPGAGSGGVALCGDDEEWTTMTRPYTAGMENGCGTLCLSRDIASCKETLASYDPVCPSGKCTQINDKFGYCIIGA